MLKKIFCKNTCIICNEPTKYYVCNKCREAVLSVRERLFPIEEELNSENFITGFFIKTKQGKKYVDRP